MTLKLGHMLPESDSDLNSGVQVTLDSHAIYGSYAPEWYMEHVCEPQNKS